MCHKNKYKWTKILSTILLGLYFYFKPDIGARCAELEQHWNYPANPLQQQHTDWTSGFRTEILEHIAWFRWTKAEDSTHETAINKHTSQYYTLLNNDEKDTGWRGLSSKAKAESNSDLSLRINQSDLLSVEINFKKAIWDAHEGGWYPFPYTPKQKICYEETLHQLVSKLETPPTAALTNIAGIFFWACDCAIYEFTIFAQVSQVSSNETHTWEFDYHWNWNLSVNKLLVLPNGMT